MCLHTVQGSTITVCIQEVDLLTNAIEHISFFELPFSKQHVEYYSHYKQQGKPLVLMCTGSHTFPWHSLEAGAASFPGAGSPEPLHW